MFAIAFFICVQVRTFLELSAQVEVMSPETRASLARSVEGWAFHEAMLEQGKALLRSKLLEGCVTLARQQRVYGHSVIPPPLLGHLDTLTVRTFHFALHQTLLTARRTLCCTGFQYRTNIAMSHAQLLVPLLTWWPIITFYMLLYLLFLMVF
jgi:hypothetical protein